MANQQQTYTRFALAQRIEHWVMTISFVILMVTGLPQRYALSTWADYIIEGLGGIEQVRIIHRIAAVVFMLVMIFHFIDVAYKVYVLRLRPSMMPTFKDVRDLFNSIRYYIGLRENHPKLPRYNFAEKIEYWAVIWGGILMALTGFMLWNPINTTSILPGQFVPAAKMAHSAEALLAFLAIIIWHVYWVHLKTFNRAMFTGKLTREQMLEEHAAELEEIESGAQPLPSPTEEIRQRRRIFTPIASVVTVVMLVGLYDFVTFERTAITTVPPEEVAQAFVPATPTPTNTPQPTATPTVTPEGGEASPASVPMISHPVAGREDCLECHAVDGPIPEPASHANYTLATCQVCHSIKQENPAPPPIKHKIEGREECSRCHKADLLPASHQEADITDENCLLCHTPANQ
jgi:formate dehydrogenase gamma subunit